MYGGYDQIELDSGLIVSCGSGKSNLFIAVLLQLRDLSLATPPAAALAFEVIASLVA